jgi:hypothetical protein
MCRADGADEWQQGWAFVVSAGKRYADEGYFEGTTMGILFLSVERKLNDSHSLNFTGFYTNSRGKNSPNSAGN